VIDIIGLAMVIPILPYYAESFGADAAQLGILYSAFSASEFVGNLLMGTLSDIFGRRVLIIISLFGSFSGYLFHGLCRNYNYLLAARIYTGFFSYSLTMAWAYISEVVPGPEQPKYMANLGAAIGMTFTICPTIGGVITAAAQNDYSVSYYAAAAVAGLGMLFAICNLKEPEEEKDNNVSFDVTPSGEKKDMTDEQEFVREIMRSKLFGFPTIVYFLGMVRFCAQVGWSAHSSMFFLFVFEKYGIPAVYLSTTMIIGSLCHAISTATLFKLLVVKLGLINTLSLGMLTMGTALMLYNLPGSEGKLNLWLTLIIQFCFFIGFGLFMPSDNSIFAKFTIPGERGKILGFGSVFMSVADIIGPIVFGLLYRLDVNLVWHTGGGSLFFGIVLLQIVEAVLHKKRSDRKNINMISFDNERVALAVEHVQELDRPYTDKDYLELGKQIGNVLYQKNWRWAAENRKIVQLFQDSFPHIPKEVITGGLIWENFWNYSQQICKQISLKRDEDYLFAQGNGWDFSTVVDGSTLWPSNIVESYVKADRRSTVCVV